MATLIAECFTDQQKPGSTKAFLQVKFQLMSAYFARISVVVVLRVILPPGIEKVAVGRFS